MTLTPEAKLALLKKVMRPDKFTIVDLVKIRTACELLKEYGLEDKELLEQTELFIAQEETHEEDEGRIDQYPRHPDNI